MSKNITTTVYTNADLPDDLRQLFKVWDAECFTEPNEFTWSKPQWHVFAYAGPEPVSYTGIFSRRCMVSGQTVPLAGIGSVMTPVKHRGHGYATAALERAHAHMTGEMDAPFALLLTEPPLITFYERLGWQAVDDPLTVNLPDGTSRLWRKVTMVCPLRDQPWPGGSINLNGLPW